ncbi:shikimate dehydrogenase [Paenisporosarcina sp. TG-14]|uniref:shikimate dehydrogenase n=1 Tax=Paenisporosarcina sp. TG-14 TaxID=1231057 RepID=UPI0002E242D1|nr:shikimate dehydrogenase [Paenisporosarcina sp. TG-14]
MKKWYAVIGDPISHSMSPSMHSKWFSDLTIDSTYIPVQVKKEKLADAVHSLKSLGASGWNVTIPHKEAILPFLDQIDSSAELMGAVNTVVVEEDGTLTGYNTDGIGFVNSLEEAMGLNLKELPILIIGAGGAARGIAFALKEQGYVNLSCANRSFSNAQRLIADLKSGRALSLEQAEVELADFKIIIQTTPAGMITTNVDMPLSLKNVTSSAIVADIVYNPLLTPFLVEAKDRGARCLNGVGMFVHQGALSFQKWTNRKPDTKQTIEQVQQILGGPHVNR